MSNISVTINSLLNGARKSKGTVVIIDVFRAFSTIPYIVDKGASKIIIAESVDSAFSLKSANPEYILVGERGGIKVKGFDYGNSPQEIINADINDRKIVFTSSAGTRGVFAATNASEILLGSFLTARSIVNYVKSKPDITEVTLVPMGLAGERKTDEDELCAVYLCNAINGVAGDFEKIKNHLRCYDTANKFFDKNNSNFVESDFHYSLDLDKFDFVLKYSRSQDEIVIIKQ